MLWRKFVRQSGIHQSWAKPRGSRGFSVIELLVVVGVMGIVAGIGVPALLNQFSRVKLEATASTISNLMVQARLRSIGGNSIDNDGVVGKEKWPHIVRVVGDEVHLLRVLNDDPLTVELVFDFQLTDTSAEIYTAGPATCVNSDIFYDSLGKAEDIGRVCIWDGDNNILEIGLQFEAGQPKTRKFLFAPDSPTGAAGFFQKTSAATSDSIWAWY